MAVVRKAAYELRLHISIKYITANVLDKSDGSLVAQVSTIEHAIKRAFEVGRTTKNPQAAAVVGEVLSRRIKLEGLHRHRQGLESGIHANVYKEVHKKGVEDAAANANIVWGIINKLRENGISIIIHDDKGDF